MPTGLSTDQGFIGTGDLLAKNLRDSASGFRPVGNASLFQLTPKVEQLERKSFQRATRGQVLDTYKRLDGVDLRIEVDTFGRENLALALSGESGDFTQAELTAQAATVTLYHDQWVELGAHNISAVTITDKTEGTDFLVKPEAGMVMALSSGTIADAAETSLTYNAPAISDGYAVTGGSLADALLQLRLDGYDEVSGKTVITDIWRVRVSPLEAFNFITGDFNKLVLTGSAETPEGQTSPLRTRVLPGIA